MTWAETEVISSVNSGQNSRRDQPRLVRMLRVDNEACAYRKQYDTIGKGVFESRMGVNGAVTLVNVPIPTVLVDENKPWSQENDIQ